MQASYKGELTLRSSRSFIQPAMFDLEIEAVGEGGGEGLKKIYISPTPTPTLIFDRRPTPSLPNLPLSLK